MRVFSAMPSQWKGLDIRPRSPCGKVYYARIERNNHTIYKVGVTSQRNTADRYKVSGITMLAEWHHETMAVARFHERKLIEQNREYRYREESPIPGMKDTEMFVIDVLGLDDVAE